MYCLLNIPISIFYYFIKIGVANLRNIKMI
jgi:hypothetical protein